MPVTSEDEGSQRSFSDIAASPQGVRPLTAKREAGGQGFDQSNVFQTGFREGVSGVPRNSDEIFAISLLCLNYLSGLLL